MENNQMIIAAVCIAALAVVARIVINKNQQKKISWPKLALVGVALAVFIAVFMLFDPYRAQVFAKGEASRQEAQTQCVSGRKADREFPRFASPADYTGLLYYAVEATDIRPTGFYRLKNMRDTENYVERKVDNTEADSHIIHRKTSLFGLTRNPRDNADKYLPIYVATLENSGKVLVAMPEYEAAAGELPIGMMQPADRLQTVIDEVADTSLIADYYFLAFDEAQYARSAFSYTIYRVIAAIIATIVVVVPCYFIFIRRKKQPRN